MFKTKEHFKFAQLINKATADHYYARRLDGKLIVNLTTGLSTTLHFVRYMNHTHAFAFEDDRRRMFHFADIPKQGQFLEDDRGTRYIICQDKDEAETILGRISESDDPEIKSLIPHNNNNPL